MWSKIIALADVYDAMTSNRPYRTAIPLPDTYEYIVGNVYSAFDQNIASAFIEKVEPYPAGSFVKLSTGGTAMVLDTKNKLRPVIRLLENNTVVDLFNDHECLNVVIVKPVSYTEAVRYGGKAV
jgi:hypothetical protein